MLIRAHSTRTTDGLLASSLGRCVVTLVWQNRLHFPLSGGRIRAFPCVFLGVTQQSRGRPFQEILWDFFEKSAALGDIDQKKHRCTRGQA